ncbi:hypothetical protein CQW23_27869 [Capsicum baccatum]|uniref:MADS-box domain-containing protein n=1 Tax=Capsicum baccatum TaxID=33114 RepID=A0A2G2VEW4_CAPBA|nr:hypothetical protein CQW23_27869 [Capsicum baccatum]
MSQKKNKIDEEVTKSDLELKEISDYAKSSEDVLPQCSVSDDSEERKGNEVGSFPAKILVRSRMAANRVFNLLTKSEEKIQVVLFWTLEKPFGTSWNQLNEDQKIKCCLLWFLHTMLLVKDSTKNVHPYIIPTVRETNMDYMITFNPYTDEVKNNVFDDLKKALEGVTVLISNEHTEDNRDLGGNPVGVCIGDDDTPSTSKDIKGTSFPGNLHKRVVTLGEALLNIAAYIREKKMNKKKKDERQHERALMAKVVAHRKTDGPPYDPSPVILKRFLSRNNTNNNPIANNSLQLLEAHRNANVCGLNLQLTQILGEVEIEKKRGESPDQMRKTSQSQCWWEVPISQLDLQELEQLKDSMEALKKYVTNQEIKFMVNEIANSFTFFGDIGNGIFDNYDIKPPRTMPSSSDLHNQSLGFDSAALF